MTFGPQSLGFPPPSVYAATSGFYAPGYQIHAATSPTAAVPNHSRILSLYLYITNSRCTGLLDATLPSLLLTVRSVRKDMKSRVQGRQSRTCTRLPRSPSSPGHDIYRF